MYACAIYFACLIGINILFICKQTDLMNSRWEQYWISCISWLYYSLNAVRSHIHMYNILLLMFTFWIVLTHIFSALKIHVSNETMHASCNIMMQTGSSKNLCDRYEFTKTIVISISLDLVNFLLNWSQDILLGPGGAMIEYGT